MIRKFLKYNKFAEFFANEFENKFAFIGTLILLSATYFFRVYDDLANYVDVFNSLLGGIIGALIGALALIFSGIVFWGSLFDKKFTEDLIRYTEDEDVIDKLYTSYLFLNFNILCNIILSLILLFAINSSIEKVCLGLFLAIEAIYAYWFLFIIGYLVATMRNCIDLIQLRDEAEAKGDKKTIYETANELRIDILFELLYRKMSAEEMHENLMTIINNRINMMDKPQEEKEKLAEYLEKFYSLEDKK